MNHPINNYDGTFTQAFDRLHDDANAMIEALTNTMRVVIKKNEFDEFELTERDGEIYYTDDRDDAIATACHIYGADCRITFRRGTYTHD
jgi:hypothetical protein